MKDNIQRELLEFIKKYKFPQMEEKRISPEAIDIKALIGGQLLDYDLCAEVKEAYEDIQNKEYIGEGYIVTPTEKGTRPHHFWIIIK